MTYEPKKLVIKIRKPAAQPDKKSPYNCGILRKKNN